MKIFAIIQEMGINVSFQNLINMSLEAFLKSDSSIWISRG